MDREALRAKIQAADDLPRVKVEVPEWGVDVWCRSMTGAERDQWEADLVARQDGGTSLANIRARLAVLTVVDETGARLFEDDEAEWLGQKGAAALDRIFDASMSLNRLRARDVEALAKN